MRIKRKKKEISKKTNKHAKTNKYEKCPTKREIDKQVFFQICNSSINLSFREVMDRRQKEKGNTCVRND